MASKAIVCTSCFQSPTISSRPTTHKQRINFHTPMLPPNLNERKQPHFPRCNPFAINTPGLSGIPFFNKIQSRSPQSSCSVTRHAYSYCCSVTRHAYSYCCSVTRHACPYSMHSSGSSAGTTGSAQDSRIHLLKKPSAAIDF
jgi:hypothetical protein